jgi:threonine synthase
MKSRKVHGQAVWDLRHSWGLRQQNQEFSRHGPIEGQIQEVNPLHRLVCTRCALEFSPGDIFWKCTCGGLLNLTFEPTFPIEKIKKRKPTLWRYREAIPIAKDDSILSFDEGFTPLVPLTFDNKKVWVKQDHLFPTGSYKDRGASVLMSKVKELGISRVVEDSSGNAGCAIAAYCALGGIRSEIYVPENTSPAKLAQIESYGAVLKKIPGSREDTARAVWEAAQKDYYASHSWNVYFFHGTKTFAFEVWEQLEWKAPDTLILPVGNGTLLLGAFIGFNELLEAGMIREIPKIVGVQSAHCAPLAKAFRERLKDIPKVHPQDTLAEGIAIAEPVRGRQTLEAVKESGGSFLSVNDGEVKKSLRFASQKGFYLEPTAAATLAGVFQYLRNSDPEEIVVSVFTGHGLKATEKILKILGEAAL